MFDPKAFIDEQVEAIRGAVKDERLQEKLKEHREAMKKWVLEDSRTLGE